MKITVDNKKEETRGLKIEKANYIGDFVIGIKFNDGTEKFVDFQPFLTKSGHPSIRKYLDERLFQYESKSYPLWLNQD